MIEPNREECIAQIRAALPALDDDQILALAWICERIASKALDASRYRGFTRAGLPRGYEIRDLEGGAVVSSVRAIAAILAFLGRTAAPRGMPARAGR